MGVEYGYAGLKLEWWDRPQMQVVKYRKWLVMSEWYVAVVWRSTPTFDYLLDSPVILAGPFKTKEAAEAARMMIKED